MLTYFKTLNLGRLTARSQQSAAFSMPLHVNTYSIRNATVLDDIFVLYAKLQDYQPMKFVNNIFSILNENVHYLLLIIIFSTHCSISFRLLHIDCINK